MQKHVYIFSGGNICKNWKSSLSSVEEKKSNFFTDFILFPTFSFFFPQLAKQPFDLPHYYPNATFCFFPTYWTPLDTSSTWILDRSTEFAPLLTHNIKENKSKQQKLLEENTPKLGYVYIFKRHSIIYCKLKQYSNLFFFTFIHLRKQILKKKIIMRWITTLGSINPKR